MVSKIISLITLYIGLTLCTQAQELPDPMQPKRLVNDFTSLFSKQETDKLEQILSDFNKTTSTQIAIVTVSSLNGYEINDYAARLGEKWGIGQKGKDNGIIILIKPKKGRTKGEIAISVGYGLEGVIPDITASRIIRQEIIPAFQQGNYYQGIQKAVAILINLTQGEFTAEEYEKQNNGSLIFFLPILLFFLLFFRKRKSYSPGHSHGPFFIGGFPFTNSSGGFSDFSSGGGSFGGFGGGSFGGGGASGSW